MDINTCALLAESSGLRAIAYYSHLLPAAIAVFLAWYALKKTRYSASAVAFATFVLTVVLWLLNDVVLWTPQNYQQVAFFWSWIDFIDVLFFILAAYFFATLARGGVSWMERILLLALSIPSFVFTVTGNTVTGLDQSWCEMYNNDAAVYFKSFVEWVAISYMFASLAVAWSRLTRGKKIAVSVVFIALLLFLATFSITEYIAAQTGVYEINLYGLFALPIFLVVMVFAVTNLQIFKIRYLGTQLLIYILVILAASQLLFLQNSTDATLSLITLGISVLISVILLRNEQREMDSLVEIETLASDLASTNIKLKELDQLKSQFLSFASHQLKTPLTAIKWQSQILADGSVGELPEAAIGAAKEIEDSTGRLIELVNEFLNLRKLQEGKMEYTFEPTDIAELTASVVTEVDPLAKHKQLKLSFVNNAKKSLCSVDRQKFTQVVQNTIDNAIKYTDNGSVDVRIENAPRGLVNIVVTDTGHGIDPAVIDKLFEQFVRDRKDASKIEGTGLGLYIAKQVMDAHHGKIWATSPGPGKGSTFFIQLKTLKS
jgi:signal transduction histidine kinase